MGIPSGGWLPVQNEICLCPVSNLDLEYQRQMRHPLNDYNDALFKQTRGQISPTNGVWFDKNFKVRQIQL